MKVNEHGLVMNSNWRIFSDEQGFFAAPDDDFMNYIREGLMIYFTTEEEAENECIKMLNEMEEKI